MKRVRQHARTKKVALFLGLTYLLDWLMAGLFWMSGAPRTPNNVMLLGALYMFVPMTAAIIVQKLVYKEPLVGPLGISFRLNRWFLGAWLLPPVLAFLAFGISLLIPGVEIHPR